MFVVGDLNGRTFVIILSHPLTGLKYTVILQTSIDSHLNKCVCMCECRNSIYDSQAVRIMAVMSYLFFFTCRGWGYDSL